MPRVVARGSSRIIVAMTIVLTLTWPSGVLVGHAQVKSATDIYLDKCAVCHGEDGAGKTARGKKLKVKDVRETIAKTSVSQMIDVVNKGKDPDMDGYGKELTPDQIRQIVDYYRGLAKKK
jgi:mono/diheme cytochrome c family protein